MTESDEQEPMEADALEETPPVEEALPSPEELAELRRKAAEHDRLMDRIKRITADYLNSQKRIERQMEERCEYAVETFARELLVVSDDLARAIAATEEHLTVEAILEGLHIVEQHLSSVLERYGITPLDAQPSSPFNPEFHEAISVTETEELEPNRIVEEVQKGFLIHKRLLRAARVVVSAKPKPALDDWESPEEDAGD